MNALPPSSVVAAAHGVGEGHRLVHAVVVFRGAHRHSLVGVAVLRRELEGFWLPDCVGVSAVRPLPAPARVTVTLLPTGSEASFTS